jgi:uncharacterized phage-associated protein
MKPSAIDVANTFLKLSDPTSGDFLTNLKIQKLVYYAQGFSLALHGEVLFHDKIVHWEHGPVVIDLYHELKDNGSDVIDVPKDFDPSKHFNEEQLELIREVQKVYGQFSAWKLRDMTHAEEPWIKTSNNEEITTDSLKSFFKTLVV